MGDDDTNRLSMLPVLKEVMHCCERILLTDGVSVLQHSLWCAHQAVTAKCTSSMVVSAMLHDIGHYICGGDPEISDYCKDKEHAALGATWLARWFPDSVCAPIALHVDAKRYLATTDEKYRRMLGAGSLQSLSHQGGHMTREELQSFRDNVHFQSALVLRQFDDTPYNNEILQPYEWYEPFLISALR